MNKPLLLVEYDGRSAAVILNKRPSTQGLLHIRYEDGSGDAEVDAGQCKINLLTDTDK
jgi:ParB family chromosome partitioning protein